MSYDTSSRYYLHLAELKLTGWIAKLEIFVDGRHDDESLYQTPHVKTQKC